MFAKSAKSVVMFAALAAAGCASVLPGDPVMEDARLSVNSARSNPQVASYASLELAQAVDALRQAEEAQRVASSMRADVYSSTMNEYRRRDNERLYEARVTYVRAVVGPPQQRCWVEPTVIDNRTPGGVNVPGAIVGGAIGGI